MNGYVLGTEDNAIVGSTRRWFCKYKKVLEVG